MCFIEVNDFAMLDYMNGRNDRIDICAWRRYLMLIVFIMCLFSCTIDPSMLRRQVASDKETARCCGKGSKT